MLSQIRPSPIYASTSIACTGSTTKGQNGPGREGKYLWSLEDELLGDQASKCISSVDVSSMESNEVHAEGGSISSDESENEEFEFRHKLSNYASNCICSRPGRSIEDRSIRNVEE